MPTRRGRKESPLAQSRLAGLNFNYQTVTRPNAPSLASADTHRQAGLEAFGFVSQKPSAKTSLPPQDEDKPRKKVAVRSPSLSPSPSPAATSSRLAASLLSSPDHPLFGEREIFETQFAQPDQLYGGDLAFLTASSPAKATPPAIASISILLKPRLSQRLPPPVTPKRRKVLEIPSSHTPPVTPISPYKSPTRFRIPQKSPLSCSRFALRSPGNKWRHQVPSQVPSSQWWENDDSQSVRVATQGGVFPELDEGEDDSDLFSHTYHPRPLFKSNGPDGNLSQMTTLELSQPSTRRRESPKMKTEQECDTSLLGRWPDIHLRVQDVVVPESPQSKATKSRMSPRSKIYFKIKTEPESEDEEDIYPRSTQTQNRREFFHREETSIPESPLSSYNSIGGLRRIQSWGSGAGCREHTQTDYMSIGRDSRDERTRHDETQYEDGSPLEYDWWDLIPTTIEDKEKEMSRGRTNSLAKGKQRDKDEGQTEIEQAKQSNQDKRTVFGVFGVDDADIEEGLITVSQLLPETLMESFPIPPPLTQWSNTSSWDDEL